MTNTQPIQTLIFPEVSFTSRPAFLKFIKRYVHTFALKRATQFAKAAHNAEYFHKNKQGVEKIPLRIHSFLHEQQFALRAYTQAGVDTLSFWHNLFKEAHPKFCKQVIQKNEIASVQSVYTTQVYESHNWIPYRNCELKNGIYYNATKNEVANFHNTLLGNLRTYLTLLGYDNALRFQLKLKTLEAQPPVIAIHNRKKGITKTAFKVAFETNLELPSLFSIGQNVGYGNGVFVKQ